jgi:glycosyltransferase involved in cell wall biosynthesis
MTDGRKDILIIMGRYLPGYKDGGPVRSIKNLTDFLGKEYNFKILTCDRDHGDTEAYPNIKVNGWNRVGNAEVYYVPPKGFSQKLIVELAGQVDLVYVCGCFNDYAINTLIANRLGKIKVPVVVAAMGLFSPGALQIKSLKKNTFINVFNTLGIFKDVYWSATSEMEVTDILNVIKTDRKKVMIAEDLPRAVKKAKIVKNKKAGELKVVFISRFSPEKNLLQAIEILQKVKSNVKFTLYGPDTNKEYWTECKKKLNKLPDNVKWEWEGNLDSEKVVETLKNQDVFLFPTQGENFGHVIQEALSAGCPCIISDQTPWQDFESQGVGYVFPLRDDNPFVEAIERYAAMEPKEFQEVSEKVHQYAIRVSNDKVKNTGYREIFM